MVFGNTNSEMPGVPLTRPQAAQAVGMRDDSLRIAFRNPVVVARYNELLQVLRESKRPRAIHEIGQLSEAAASEAVKLNASKYLDSNGESDRPGSVNVQVNVQQPGYVLGVDPRFADVIPAQQQLTKLATNEHKPLKDKGSVLAES